MVELKFKTVALVLAVSVVKSSCLVLLVFVSEEVRFSVVALVAVDSVWSVVVNPGLAIKVVGFFNTWFSVNEVCFSVLNLFVSEDVKSVVVSSILFGYDSSVVDVINVGRVEVKETFAFSHFSISKRKCVETDGILFSVFNFYYIISCR